MYYWNSCRVCLSHLKSIPTELRLISQMDDSNTEIAVAIELLGGVKIDREVAIAQTICENCFVDLQNAQEFRKKCKESEKLLDNFYEVALEQKYQPENIKIEDVDFFDTDDLPTNETVIEDIEEHCEDNCGLDSTDPILTSKTEESSSEVRAKTKKTQKTLRKKEIHMCDLCGNIFVKRCLLLMHMRRHNNERNFECEICKKRFLCHSELARHMRVHTGAKPFKCQYCDRRFADRSTNIKHERTHTNERPFVCDTCGKAFMYSNVLKNHILTHTGEKKFECKPCRKVFSRPHQLKQHFGTITHQQTVFKEKCMDEVELFNKT